MNKKLLPSAISLMLTLAFISSVFIVTQKTAEAQHTPSLTSWGTQTLATDSLRVRFPGVALAPNGDLVMTYCRGDTIDYSCWMELYCRISHDNGTTWDAPYLIHTFNSYTGEVGWTIKTMPNGDLCFLFTDDHEWQVHNGTDIWRNSENGSQGNWAYSGNFSEFGMCYVYDWVTYGDSVYAFVNDPHIFSGCTRYIAISNDSGYTWEKFGNNIESTGGEWSGLSYTADASSWKTINRFTSFGNSPSGTSSCGSTASSVPYAPIREQWQTTNSGVTWTDMNSNCPDACGTSAQTSNQYNKGNYMWWLDDEVAVANVETVSNYATVIFSYDNLTTWHNRINLGYEGSSAPKNAYSRGCALPKRAGDIGGWGYVVWSEQRNTYVKGCWVANNASLVWTYPPGRANVTAPSTPSPQPEGEWLNINNLANGSQTGQMYRFYNATKVPNTLYYQILISTSSLFPFIIGQTISIDGINETNYGVNFDENATRWFFADPTSMIGHGFGNGKHYYKFRARKLTVTT